MCLYRFFIEKGIKKGKQIEQVEPKKDKASGMKVS